MRAGAKRIAVGDINGDGTQDFAIANWSSDLRVVFGDKSLADMRNVPIGALRNPWNLAVQDLNGDGRGDLAVTDGTLPLAMLYLSRADP